MVDDPARGRVLLIAPEREPVLAKSGAEWMPSFIDLLQRKLTRITDPAVQAMVATGLVGALTALFTAYLNGRLATTREQFIDYCVDMLLSRVSSHYRLLVGRWQTSASAASSSCCSLFFGRLLLGGLGRGGLLRWPTKCPVWSPRQRRRCSSSRTARCRTRECRRSRWRRARSAIG